MLITVECADHQPQRPITWWLKHVDGLLEVAFDRSLEREGIGRPHWQVLNAVAGGAATGAEVEQAFARLRVDGAVQVRAALTALVNRDWVRVSQGRLSLTPDGAAARERLARAARAQRERLTHGIEPEHYRTTIDTLRQMARNLTA
ncbi:MAG TPA: hypothetical protein VGM60_22270 [Pseudonocardia sp.]|uniref:hypothetical protein n=1 Tax=Pseudonocardia sp. TaxID=60912 RepID=UPI002F3E3065